jgi:hypothetical protein
MQSRDGKGAERDKRQHEGADGRGPSCDSHPPPTQGATGRQVGDERVELAERPSCKQGLKASFQLVRVQASLSRRVP